MFVLVCLDITDTLSGQVIKFDICSRLMARYFFQEWQRPLSHSTFYFFYHIILSVFAFFLQYNEDNFCDIDEM